VTASKPSALRVLLSVAASLTSMALAAGPARLAAAPLVPPRFADTADFSPQELEAARVSWALAVEAVWEAREVASRLESGPRASRADFWDNRVGEWRPVAWFGAFNEGRFDNLRRVIDRVWNKLSGTSAVVWKLKRQACVLDAAAHVVVVGQIRLCDDFFHTYENCGAAAAARILVHELSHHVGILHPPVVLTDSHAAPIPPCTGPYGRCYGRDDAQRLGRDYPDHAAANPDNYAYFVVELASALRIARETGRELYPSRGGGSRGAPAGHTARPVGELVPLEPRTDRTCGDYRDFDLQQARPERCRDECLRDGRCRAFTYGAPGLFGNPHGHCWLKERAEVPGVNANCTSGVVPAGLPRPLR